MKPLRVMGSMLDHQKALLLAQAWSPQACLKSEAVELKGFHLCRGESSGSEARMHLQINAER